MSQTAFHLTQQAVYTCYTTFIVGIESITVLEVAFNSKFVAEILEIGRVARMKFRLLRLSPTSPDFAARALRPISRERDSLFFGPPRERPSFYRSTKSYLRARYIASTRKVSARSLRIRLRLEFDSPQQADICNTRSRGQLRNSRSGKFTTPREAVGIMNRDHRGRGWEGGEGAPGANVTRATVW